jgi:protein O-GlcNAc transferase
MQTEDCVEAHTNVDVVVNLGELRALLESRLPLVFGGASVAEAALPWPAP